ncbi:signal peptidase II [Nocardioides jensenii]|uniref:signal peptidase II n=1 Tax=Nocardioides jensenii TaxID=1843 RepID=UPI00082F9B32|nr:signal peptidase II [Nocardioides jensenii]
MQAARGTSLNASDTPESDPDGSSSRIRSLQIFWGVGITGFLVDLLSKNWALGSLEGRGRVDVLGDLFGFRLTRNPGAAFSTGTAFTEALTVFAMVAVCVVVFLSFRVRNTGWAIGFGFLLAGVSGNLADRLTRDPGVMRGHVIDFLELPNWPIFNVADILINLAAVTIIVMAIRGRRLDGTLHD